jgi:hypothetical protein
MKMDGLVVWWPHYYQIIIVHDVITNMMGTIWRRKIIVKKLCPFVKPICPNPLAFPQA